MTCVVEVITETEHITRIAPMASLNEPTISTTTTTSTVPEVSFKRIVYVKR